MDRIRIGKPFDEINDAFHTAYARSVDEAKSNAPLLIVIGDALIVRHADARREENIGPPIVHAIKSIVHWPIALYVFATGSKGNEIDFAALKRRVTSHDAMFESYESSVAAQCRAIVDACCEFIDHHFAEPEAFAKSVGPHLIEATDSATKIQLASLEKAARAIIDDMTEEERRGFEVIVAGAHQARDRNLPMQYFKKLIGEKLDYDERVAYAEGVADEAGALKLAGKRRVDRNTALAFFGDAKRLQRDVLGDSATRLLSKG